MSATAQPMASHCGWSRSAPAPAMPGPERHEHRDRHGQRHAAPAGEDLPGGLCDQDVRGPARRRHERQQHADGVDGAAAGIGQQHDPDRRQRRAGEVQAPARERHRDGQRAGELDRHRDAERDARERLVDAQVHGAQHDPEGGHEAQVARRVTAHARAPDRLQDHRREERPQ